jgi:hypothetical protein
MFSRLCAEGIPKETRERKVYKFTLLNSRHGISRHAWH